VSTSQALPAFLGCTPNCFLINTIRLRNPTDQFFHFSFAPQMLNGNKSPWSTPALFLPVTPDTPDTPVVHGRVRTRVPIPAHHLGRVGCWPSTGPTANDCSHTAQGRDPVNNATGCTSFSFPLRKGSSVSLHFSTRPTGLSGPSSVISRVMTLDGPPVVTTVLVKIPSAILVAVKAK
jgi:hypothetical protein